MNIVKTKDANMQQEVARKRRRIKDDRFSIAQPPSRVSTSYLSSIINGVTERGRCLYYRGDSAEGRASFITTKQRYQPGPHHSSSSSICFTINLYKELPSISPLYATSYALHPVRSALITALCAFAFELEQYSQNHGARHWLALTPIYLWRWALI